MHVCSTKRFHNAQPKQSLFATAQRQETSESERGSETTVQSDDGAPDMEEGTCKTQCNTSLPLPSTEEGTTVLVTTKTVQTSTVHNCSAHYTEDVTFGVRTSGIL